MAAAPGFLLTRLSAQPPRLLDALIALAVVAETALAALPAPSIVKRLISEFAAAAPTPPKGIDELTARELALPRLTARRLSNAEIAAERIASDTTVKTHFARVLMKLGLRDRVQAVVLAYKSGISVPGRQSP